MRFFFTMFSTSARVVKDVKFPNPSGIVVKLLHELKPKTVKEVRFPNPSGIVVKLIQSFK